MRKQKADTSNTPTPSSPATRSSAPLTRNRLELIRFRTQQDQLEAFRIFRENASSDTFFTFRKEWPEGVCQTNTSTVRALQGLGVPFEWLTENV
jgi:hypothetical protein